ncbi:MAG: site-specific integrase, partial [Planctomycetota bacterium]
MAAPRSTPRPSDLPRLLGRVHSQFLSYLRTECGLSVATLEAYGRDLAVCLDDLARSGVSEPEHITTRWLSEHLQRLSREGKSGATVGRHLATIRVFGRWLEARGMAPTNPAEILER